MKLRLKTSIFWCLVVVLSTKQALAQLPTVNTSTASPTTTTTTGLAYGVMTITIEPSNWVNYSGNATVTFSFQPPCPNISLFTTTMMSLETCALGPACPFATKFASTIQTYDSQGAWIRISNVTTLSNGYYYGTCPVVLRPYRTATMPGTNNLVLGVNPRVIKMSVQQGLFSSAMYNFTRYSNNNNNNNGGLDQFTYYSSIPLSVYDSATILFGVGKGYNPDSQIGGSSIFSANTNFTFSVPDFDMAAGNYSFIRKSFVSSSVMYDVTPYGEWFGYSLSKADLAANKMCSIEGRAIATLRGAPRQDIVTFRADFTYPLTIGAVSLDRGSGGLAAGQCSCTFTCNVAACPPQVPTRFEWAFFDNSTTGYYNDITYQPGNVPGRADQLSLSYQDCQAKFKLARRTPRYYNIRCRAYSMFSSSQPSADYQTALWELMRPCTPSEFRCERNFQCIPAGRRCNGKFDCLDRTDEDGCTVGLCRLGEFNCPQSRECISNTKLCDSVVDCGDGSDERNCTQAKTPCATGFYRCSNRKCVRGRYVCDGDNDCGDRSDETRCGGSMYSSMPGRCSSSEFICSNGNCVPRFNVCDGINSCGDNSDEDNCGTYYSAVCGTDNWQCANARCVMSYDLCDGSDDCGDNSDEINCASGIVYAGDTSSPALYTTPPGPILTSLCDPGYFQCNNGHCTQNSNLCDGDNDCGDYSDESNVTCATCPTGRFRCNNNRCINAAYVCDGDNDCRDYSDEASSICSACPVSLNMWRCKVSGKCIHISRLCDMSSSCGPGDSSDESPEACSIAQSSVATVTKCPAGTIRCLSINLCVPESALCNGIQDCCASRLSTSSSSWSSLFSPSLPMFENETHIGDCEKTDEIGCNRNATCAIRNGGCSGRCIAITMPAEPSVCGGLTPAGEAAYCACEQGFRRPLSNYADCVDIDECQAPLANNCSQICTNTRGSFNCSCVPGFVDKNTISSAIASNSNATGFCVVPSSSPPSPNDLPRDPTVLFIYGDTLRMWQSPKATVLLQTSLDKTFTAIDVDIRDGTIIYAEVGEPTLRRTSLPVNGVQPASLALHNPVPYDLVVDMAVDFIGNNLYVADIDYRMQSRIVVSLVDGRYQKTIIRSSIKITSIAVNPLRGRLYYATYSTGSSSYPTSSWSSWSSWSSSYSSSSVNQAAIIMTSMNGSQFSNVEVYRTRSGNMIQTIAVDYLAGGRLYFCDGSRIFLANYDGTGNATFTLSMYAPADRAFDVFGNLLYGFFVTSSYYSMESQQMLYEVDKFSRVLASNLTNYMLQVSNARVYHPLKAGQKSSWPEPCRALKCSHLCLLNMEGKADCFCPDTTTSRQNCSAKTIVEPDHPAACFKTCTQGQGICAKDPEREAYVCICNRFFMGPFCNETLMPNVANVTIADLSPVNATLAPLVGKNEVDSSSSSSTSSSSSNNGILVALIVVACILLVVVILAIVGGVIIWRRRHAAALANFNMSRLAASSEHVDAVQ